MVILVMMMINEQDGQGKREEQQRGYVRQIDRERRLRMGACCQPQLSCVSVSELNATKVHSRITCRSTDRAVLQLRRSGSKTLT